MQLIENISQCDIILMCGPPLSGKTYLYDLILKNSQFTKISEKLSVFNIYTLGQYALQSGNKIIIDRRSASAFERLKWINLAKKMKVSIGFIHMNTGQDYILNNYDSVQLDEVKKLDLRFQIDKYYKDFRAPDEVELDGYDAYLQLNTLLTIDEINQLDKNYKLFTKHG